ncbi:amine sulfotransferase-like [Glandiceps talaboti]
MEEKWPVFFQDGCYFVKSVHDENFVKERRINDWDIRDDDIIVQTFPKSGTIWMFNAISKLYPDLNWKLPSTGKMARLGQFYESTEGKEGLYAEQVRSLKSSLEQLPSPRLLICHVPPQFFHKAWQEGKTKCKIIYITRNPKDVCVSFYNFVKSVKFAEMNLTWDEWFEAFVNGKVWYGPWIDNVLAWKRYRVNDNVCHVTYEDMKRDMKSVLAKIVRFLGRPKSDEEIDAVVNRCHIDSMRAAGDDTVTMVVRDDTSWKEGGKYFRKGQVGNWKHYFTVAQNEIFDREITSELEKRGLGFNLE